jgi:hypothetical protein
VTLGVADRQGVLGDPVDDFCGERLDGTVYGLLHHKRDRLFGDELFADLFTTRGRRSIPPSVVACVLVLKQLEGLSDVEAIDRFTYPWLPPRQHRPPRRPPAKPVCFVQLLQRGGRRGRPAEAEAQNGELRPRHPRQALGETVRSTCSMTTSPPGSPCPSRP